MKRLALLLVLCATPCWAQQPTINLDYYNEWIGRIMAEASQMRAERDQLKQQVQSLQTELAKAMAEKTKEKKQ